MSSLPKPVLRGHVSRYGLRSLIISIATGLVSASAFYYATGYRRRCAYEEWVKTYDPQEHYKEMVKYGYIWSPDKKEDD